MARARQGDLATLARAQASGHLDCYSEVLDALIEEAAENDEKLRAIAAHIAASDQLRASTGLAEALISVCERAPGRSAIAEMLRTAALTDDATVFQKAVEAALAHWRQGRAQMTAEKLHLLIESQYWTLAPEARRSGAGFILKRSLIRARRELAAAARRAAT